MRTLIILCILLFPTDLAAQRTDTEREKEVRAYLDSALRSKDPAEIAEAWYRLAKIERTRLNILESNKSLYNAIRILEKSGPSYELGRCYFWLSGNAFEVRNTEESIRYLRKALNIHDAADSDRGRMLCYSALAIRYRNHLSSFTTSFDDDVLPPDYDKAMYFADLALSYAQKINDGEAITGILNEKQRILDLKNGKENRHYVEVNPQLIKEHPERGDVILNKLDYALYLIKKGKEKEALNWIEDSERSILKYYKNHDNVKRFLHKAYADYFMAVKNYPEAIDHLQRFYKTNTKVLMDDREGAISELHISYETQKREAELKIQEQNLKNTRRLLWLSTGFLIVSLGLGAFLYRVSQKNKAISRRNTLLVQEQNHRVKNNLQVVSSLLNLQANALEDHETRQVIDEAQLRISAMIHLHRQLYENEQVDRIDMNRFIADLADNVLDSFDLGHVTLNIDASGILLPADTATLLGLLINELVTNSCKYAFPGHPDPRLSIQLSGEPGKTLQLRVKDNGLQTPDLDRNTSFGSRLIRMMVSQLDGTSEYTYHNGLEFLLTF